MLEKQEIPDGENAILASLEPEVQIKEEKDILDIPFGGIKIKKEVEGIFELGEIKVEGFSCEEIKVKHEEYIYEDGSHDEDQEENKVTDFIQNLNKDIVSFRQKRWSSLVDKPAISYEENSPLMCKKCFSKFHSVSELLSHEENNCDSYQCSECDEAFDREISLKIHKAFHGTFKRWKCDICNKSYTRKSTLNDHTLTHSGEKPYQCDVCKKFYRSKISLAYHLRYHFLSKKYECPVCRSQFFQPSGLRMHLKIHKNVKKYKCNICDKCYPYNSSLKRHVKSHTGSERYSCDECNKDFKQKSTLHVHKRTVHLGLRPFKCEDCDKAFTRARALRLHMNSHKVLQIHRTVEIVSGKNDDG